MVKTLPPPRTLQILVSYALLMASGLGTTACKQAEPDQKGDGIFEVLEGDEIRFEGIGKIENLNAQERAIFQGDQEYVRKLVPEGATVTLNHADQRQHRFVLARLKIAGKTPENSPELFRMINDIRTQHLSKGFQPGTFASLSGNGRKNMHFIGATSINADTMRGVSGGSIQQNTYYNYLDSGIWDGNWNPLGNIAYQEGYGLMPYRSVASTGNLTLAQNPHYIVDSLLIQDNAIEGYKETYTTAGRERGPTIVTTVIDPHVTPGVGTACIDICLDRTWAGDCEHDLTGSGQLKIPLKGNATITTNAPPYVFDQNKINSYKLGTEAGGSIRVVLANGGGGCDVDNNGSISLGMQKFWSTVTLSADLKTLSWDMTGANVAVFDSSCRLVQQNVVLNMLVDLPWLQGGNTGLAHLVVTNNPNTPEKNLDCITVTNSCLAAGTMIEMVDGKSVPIESIQAGDSVANPFDRSDFALTVVNTAKGIEIPSMVRITDERGKSLLMTEMHPIDVVGRGMVIAQHLKEGDVVTTKDGPSRLVTVVREQYDGKVYNVKLGTDNELQSLGADQTTVYANGFLVGDGRIQTKLETLEMTRSRPTLLPKRWRKDYLNSAKR